MNTNELFRSHYFNLILLMVAADYNYASKKRPNTNHEDISYFASWNGVRLQIISNQQNVVQ